MVYAQKNWRGEKGMISGIKWPDRDDGEVGRHVDFAAYG
jgi:hypothetical protein